ncbi:hypothetical protein C4D60_Mb06t27110 [Musa balbisiana]|uniref:Uncharacterized protein n=1 Tax=Musa balbisiana TaxID=52838 RepID=A0A4V4H470_MUSBA|nr:hypothetical protein C4D60_Mb06t27110 [Musa balbisiana]
MSSTLFFLPSPKTTASPSNRLSIPGFRPPRLHSLRWRAAVSVRASIATKPRPTVIPFDPAVETKQDVGSGRKLAAWTSIRQERWDGELVVEGEIPLWLYDLQKGTYLRNGPGIWNIDDYNFRHLFDGYATLVRVCFEHGGVTASHRQIESEAYKAAMKNRRLCYRESPNLPASSPTLGDGRVVCLTETIKGSVQIDPDTLDTVGRFVYEDNLVGLIQSAHPIVTESEFLTLLPDLVRPGYLVVRMEPGSNERNVVGRVNCRGGPAPGWVHSFAVTDRYVVVPEMPLRYCVHNLLRAEPTPLYKFEWHPESGSHEERRLCYREFSEAPKPTSFLAYVGELASLLSGASLTDNSNTGVVRLGGRPRVGASDSDRVGVPDAVAGLGEAGYLVVRMEPGSNERNVVGRVNCRGGPAPGWVHSFAVTDRYVVVPEMPLRYCVHNLLRAELLPRSIS